MILPFTKLGKNRLWGDIKSSVLHKRSLRYCWNIQVEKTGRKQDVDMFVIIDCHLRFQGYQLFGCLGGRECRKGTRNSTLSFLLLVLVNVSTTHQPATPSVWNFLRSVASPTPPPSSLQVLSTVASSFANLETLTSPVFYSWSHSCSLGLCHLIVD